MEKILWALNKMPKSDDKCLPVMSLENIKQAREFHKSFPQYTITPLAKLDGMAEGLGLGGLFVKDESYRFGLNAFKVLGGSFAMARYIASEMGRDVSEMTYDYLTSEKFRESSVRQPSSLLLTATTAEVLHGQQTSWARRLLYICRRAVPRPVLTTSQKRAQRLPSRK